MIQRIQSVYLLLAALAALVFLVVPFGSVTENNETILLKASMNIVLVIFVALLALLALGAIFLFRNRPLQMRVVLIDGILSLLFIGFMVFGITLHAMNDGFRPQPGILLPIFILVFLYLAHRSIKHDENLVRSMDRLR